LPVYAPSERALVLHRFAAATVSDAASPEIACEPIVSDARSDCLPRGRTTTASALPSSAVPVPARFQVEPTLRSTTTSVPSGAPATAAVAKNP
jgi:hypothetical protein